MDLDLPPPRPGQARVVLIGGGVTAALTGCALAERGFQVVVLEEREKGAGSSSRSAAAIRQQFSTPDTVRGMMFAVRFYERFAEEMACHPGTAPVLVQNGYLFLHGLNDPDGGSSAAEQRWKRALQAMAMQKDVGLAEVSALTPDQIGERFPFLDASLLRGATFCPTDGFIRPDLVYLEGFRRLQELGGHLRAWTPVLSGEQQGGRLTAVITPRGRVEGDLFVNATNAWAPRVSRLLGGASLPISPVKRYLYFLQRDEGLSAQELLGFPMIITPLGAYCRPENGEQLMAGWAHSAPAEPLFTHEDQDAIAPEFFHKHGLDNHGFRTWMALAESIPKVGEFKGITATTAGYYGDTPDHNPLLGHDPAVENLLHACGFSGHGVMQAPFTARVVATLAEAGRDIPHLFLPGQEGSQVNLRSFSLQREFGHGEEMVI